MIQEADANKMLIQGSNIIRTYINNIPIEVRTYLEEGVLLSIDTLAEHSERVINNLVNLAKR